MLVVLRVPCQDHYQLQQSSSQNRLVTEIPKVGVLLPEWWVTLHQYVYMTVHSGLGKWMHTLPSHPVLGAPQGLG